LRDHIEKIFPHDEFEKNTLFAKQSKQMIIISIILKNITKQLVILRQKRGFTALNNDKQYKKGTLVDFQRLKIEY